jgi:hypothetical protein
LLSPGVLVAVAFQLHNLLNHDCGLLCIGGLAGLG